jgi:hypothetical protein
LCTAPEDMVPRMIVAHSRPFDLWVQRVFGLLKFMLTVHTLMLSQSLRKRPLLFFINHDVLSRALRILSGAPVLR